ncbi:Fic family protein, partial [Klebsiella aerogenes]|uniref:Fic family protein n=1 Tax=Klebsiella aerogenes TaxID=548 RepID=UPI001953F9EF
RALRSIALAMGSVHRLVAIHPFANGNGRHARTMTDLLLVQALQRPRFTWGSGNLVIVGDLE